MANKVLGMHRLKNKVNRNAFDLTHRHMFTAQVGELLPVFTQWVNPNETFKIGYNGKTRTAALNSDAFTRIRENIVSYSDTHSKTENQNVTSKIHKNLTPNRRITNSGDVQHTTTTLKGLQNLYYYR